ncbi:MAG: HEPN domain-containing protein [Microcystis panniformis WG22]|nr:HEPN domain-containing protein [Microcystis panniformis WG22]
MENHLRAYITKFMTTKIGVNWWKTEAPQDFSKKVNDRKNNETKFASYIDNKLYLIDFNDLGEYIYKLSSGCITKEDLIKKIDGLEETPEAIRKLKEETKSNGDKFFKESFKDRNFQSNWEKLYKTRNKVAHNNLFTQKELDEAQKIYQDLIQTIKNAEQKLEGLILTTEEVGLIQEEANSIEDRQYPIEKLMDIVGKLPSKKLMAPLRKSPSKKMDLVGKLPSCHSLITPSGLNLRRMKTEKLMDLLRKSPSDGFFGLCYAMDGVIRDETLIEKDIDAILSIVFDLERTNQ